MRTRPASRLLIMSPDHRLLLFRFTHRDDALAGRSYWATPGGGVEDGESFSEAALRELREETGIVRASPGPEVAQRTFTMQLPNGGRRALFYCSRGPRRNRFFRLERE